MPARSTSRRPRPLTKFTAGELSLLDALEIAVELIGDPSVTRGAAKILAERIEINAAALALLLRDDRDPHGG